ncbi:hypothetical protein [Pseudanabaena sp. UWO310]|uniref:hypothetical protein n=1 Tax=Pseudanabaena sp. UWO310 TaxID=2480795 RepID=UPI00115A437E|nr:hypothetical protein [Pseudanabaena sp. UWO310]TYQ31403.1 hypothetical protein PseudUWO310_03665 [Pseudanabaena sp. UWO310]
MLEPSLIWTYPPSAGFTHSIVVLTGKIVSYLRGRLPVSQGVELFTSPIHKPFYGLAGYWGY